MINNAYKSIKTTILGLIVIIAAVASIFFSDGMSWWDASVGIAIGLALIFAPDSVLNRLNTLFTKSKNLPDAIQENVGAIPQEPPILIDPSPVDNVGDTPVPKKRTRKSTTSTTNNNSEKRHGDNNKKGHNNKSSKKNKE